MFTTVHTLQTFFVFNIVYDLHLLLLWPLWGRGNNLQTEDRCIKSYGEYGEAVI